MKNVLDTLFAAAGAFVTAKGTALLKDCVIAVLVALAICALPGGWWLALLASVGVLVVLHVVHFNGAAPSNTPETKDPAKP